MTATKADLQALLERVEKAEKPDHNGLDRDLHEALTGQCTHRETRYYCIEDGNDCDSGHECVACGKDTYGEKFPNYTASIDAAVALVEKVLPGAPWYVGVPTLGADHHKGKAGAAILHPSIMSFYNHRGFGPTPALALCAALLKALIAGERIGSESQAQTAIEQNKNLPPEDVE